MCCKEFARCLLVLVAPWEGWDAPCVYVRLGSSVLRSAFAYLSRLTFGEISLDRRSIRDREQGAYVLCTGRFRNRTLKSAFIQDQGWDGRTWIEMNFWVCSLYLVRTFGGTNFWVSLLQKILFAYTTNTFWGSFRYKTCNWF